MPTYETLVDNSLPVDSLKLLETASTMAGQRRAVSPGLFDFWLEYWRLCTWILLL